MQQVVDWNCFMLEGQTQTLSVPNEHCMSFKLCSSNSLLSCNFQLSRNWSLQKSSISRQSPSIWSPTRSISSRLSDGMSSSSTPIIQASPSTPPRLSSPGSWNSEKFPWAEDVEGNYDPVNLKGILDSPYSINQLIARYRCIWPLLLVICSCSVMLIALALVSRAVESLEWLKTV